MVNTLYVLAYPFHVCLLSCLDYRPRGDDVTGFVVLDRVSEERLRVDRLTVGERFHVDGLQHVSIGRHVGLFVGEGRRRGGGGRVGVEEGRK